eukprot:TRINITY_DN1967_c3_g2_i1.p1 TRINITY_DN1967_c3_g2~~TRINITY_DN1967_c3_g2_i1.p1  ORF type:complete len:544 (-),score=77.45 TRINITY_DN1967_c3_g2_i1:89-1519(-)
MGNIQNKMGGPRVRLEDFDVIKLIGKGAFGKVFKVRKKDVGEIYAMKVLRKHDIIEQDLVNHTKLERDIMGSLRHHPFIVHLHFAFQTEDKLYFVIDYINGGSLFTHLRSYGPFDERLAQFYSAEVVLALEALHKSDIVYRDLKLENLLLDEDGHIRVTDFGLSARMRTGVDRIHSFSGTAAYIAPEILTDKGEGHGKSVDWWSFGVLLHLFLTHEPPFWSENHKTLFEKIITESLNMSRFKRMSVEAKSLLTSLLEKNPENRLGCGPNGIEDIKNHPFFRDVDWEAMLRGEVTPPFTPSVEDFERQVMVCDPSLPTPARKPMRKRQFKGFSFVADPPPLGSQSAPNLSNTSSAGSLPAQRGTTDGGDGTSDEDSASEDVENPFWGETQKPVWIPDDQQPTCFKCDVRFSTFTRRHHCRRCGQIFCDACSDNRVRLPNIGYHSLSRVCGVCYRRAMQASGGRPSDTAQSFNDAVQA